MENYIKNNIKGEILIPLETYYKQKEIYKINLTNITEYNYKSFRSIVFTNEYLHFFLVISIEPDEVNNFKINDISEFIKNNCFINIQYDKKYQEKEEENIDNNNLKDEIYYTLEKIKDKKKFVNNGTLKQYKILEDRNIIIYELFSKIQLKEPINNRIINDTKIDLNISIIYNKKDNSYDDLDINDIHIFNYIDFNDDNDSENINYISPNKYTIFNITKTLTMVNPLKINSMNQYDCGNNKYLLTIKIENITYKINFLDQSLKNSLILKKDKSIIFEEDNNNVKLYFEFPIILTNIYIDNEKTLINDILFLNFLKFEQERNTLGKFIVDSNGIKYNILNAKFPVIIFPKEVYNLVISIEKRYSNYLILESNIKNKTLKEKEDANMINQLIKLSIITPVYVNISSEKPIHNLIWNFSFKWKDEINNKLNITFNIDKSDIIIYNFFKVFFKIKKLHKEKIKLEFRFNNSYEEFTLKKKEEEANKGDNLPDIFPEKKSFIVELEENEFEKVVEFRYIPIRKEYIEFPPFEIHDIFLNKIYLVFFTNKIYVS